MGFTDCLFIAIGLGRNIRHRHRRFHASTLISKAQIESLTIEAPEPSAHVRDSDAGRTGFPSCCEAGAIVIDMQRKRFVQASGCNANRSSMSTFRNAVFDRILDHGLQNQARNLCREKFCRNIHAEFQTVNKTRFLNIEILLREVEFFCERNLLPVGILDDTPE